MRAPTVLLAGCLAAGGALAQRLELEPSAAVRCLTLSGEGLEVPEYPVGAWKLDRTATVQAALRFTSPDKSPAVETTVRGGQGFVADFEAAVRQHVARLRVPCMDPESGPVLLNQIYEFRPDTRQVHWAGTSDPADKARRAALECVAHRQGQTAPPYPALAERAQVKGRVLARLRFVGPDVAPQAEFFHRRAARQLKRAAEEWVRELRMPCHPGGVVEASYQFVFRLGDDAYGMKPMTLLQLLGSVRGLRQRGLTVDTHAMGCPFDLRFRFQQPLLPNRIGEVGDTDAARRPLIQFLEQVDLVSDEATLDAVYGDETVVTVPCVKIAIQPQEKTS